MQNPVIGDYLGNASRPLTEEELPTGFYRFTRRSFMDQEKYVQGLVYVFRKDGNAFLKGFEAKAAMRQQGLSSDLRNREFRGAFLRQEDGFAILVSRHNATTFSFNYLARVPTFENNFWVGYVTRPVRENVAGRRVERLVYEFLGRDMARVLPAARTAGFCSADDLVQYHRQLLKPGEAFA